MLERMTKSAFAVASPAHPSLPPRRQAATCRQTQDHEQCAGQSKGEYWHKESELEASAHHFRHCDRYPGEMRACAGRASRTATTAWRTTTGHSSGLAKSPPIAR